MDFVLIHSISHPIPPKDVSLRNVEWRGYFLARDVCFFAMKPTLAVWDEEGGGGINIEFSTTNYYVFPISQTNSSNMTSPTDLSDQVVLV
jgi:hypothetical protein